MADLAWLNQAPPAEAAKALFRCCGCAGWAREVVAARPFASADALFEAAERAWSKASPEDIHEAFSHHPRIGDREAMKARFPATQAWSEGEQSVAATADEQVLDELARANRDYEAKFDHIFIVCASGKTATEMLALLRARLANDPETELRIAAGEQMKITRLRITKLLAEAGPGGGRMKSAITTHVLDTSIGRPAENVAAVLDRVTETGTERMGQSATNADGRITDLLDGPLDLGRYRITFDTASYFEGRGVPCFFPEVAISFEVKDASQHHHVPLLLSPFGYSTYRGT